MRLRPIPKIITIKINESGCFIVTNRKLSADGYIGKSHLHRIIYENAFGLKDDEIVRHKCNNKLCINPDHLISGTHAENVADRVKANRSARGKRHGRAKLTESQVKTIRSLKRFSISQLARKFSVDRHLIRKIRNNELWTHIS